MAQKEVFWHLPGFYIHFNFHQVWMRLMKLYPDCFMDGYRIGSVYGTFPGAIWNGGRAVIGTTRKSIMERIIDTYNRAGIPVRFTWTNSLLEEKHTYDTYCNLIMEVANNGKNQVLVNTSVLEEYLRRTYPDFAYISSTTKRITTLEALESELERDYALVVLDYDLNHNEDVLKAIEPHADKIEILVDEICFPGCPKRKAHYEAESRQQLLFDQGTPFPCPNIAQTPSFLEATKRPAFIGKDEIASYVERGFVNFKIVGRGLPFEMVKESYLYYFVKDEKMPFIRQQMDAELAKFPKV